METGFQVRKRKFSVCSPINVNNMKRFKSEKLDNFPKSDIKNESKGDLEIVKFDISKSMFKADHILCEICKKQVKSIYYRSHLSQHDKTEKCEHCLKTFTAIGIQRHSCTIFYCETCGKKYTIRSKFESHLRHHARIEERKSLVGVLMQFFH